QPVVNLILLEVMKVICHLRHAQLRTKPSNCETGTATNSQRVCTSFISRRRTPFPPCAALAAKAYRSLSRHARTISPFLQRKFPMAQRRSNALLPFVKRKTGKGSGQHLRKASSISSQPTTRPVPRQ